MSNVISVQDKVSYKIIDNYLPKEQFDQIYDYITAPDFAWFLMDTVAYWYERNNIDFYFVHTVYQDHKPNSDIYNLLYNTILKRLNPKAILRIKCNLYTNLGMALNNAMHTDYEFKHKGALFFLTDCDGPTTLADGTKVESVKNRMLLFDPSVEHCSSHPTNAKQRFTIIVNYF